MAKTKVRVLYPTAFTAAGVEVYTQKDGRDLQLEEVEIEAALADQLVKTGYAEEVKAKLAEKASTKKASS